MADGAQQPRLSSTPPGVRLCPFDEIPDNGARGFVLQMRAGRFHGFVVRKSDTAFGYADLCPHAGLPLAQKLDDYVTPGGGHIVCSWHGAIFDVEDGRCVGGPCSGQLLTRWPIKITDGWLITD